MCTGLTHQAMPCTVSFLGGRDAERERQKYDFCLLLPLGLAWEWRVQEQSEMSYGAQDGVWKSYFISLSFPSRLSVVRNMFYLLFFSFFLFLAVVSSPDRGAEDEKLLVKNCHFRNVVRGRGKRENVYLEQFEPNEAKRARINQTMSLTT